MAKFKGRESVQEDKRDSDCFDDRWRPVAPFVAALVHDHGKKEQVGEKVQVLDGVGVENDSAKKARCEQKHVGYTCSKICNIPKTKQNTLKKNDELVQYLLVGHIKCF